MIYMECDGNVQCDHLSNMSNSWPGLGEPLRKQHLRIVVKVRMCNVLEVPPDITSSIQFALENQPFIIIHP